MIPLSVPNLSGNEWKYIKECLDTNWVSSAGQQVNEFEKVIANFCGTRYAVATSNGTAALHISLLIAGIEPSDLVIIPNITFVAPVNAIKYVGANPLFVDIDPDTWQMDLALLDKFLDKNAHMHDGKCVHKSSGKKITAILPIHVLGNMCNMQELLRIANKYKLLIIEDATEALGSYYKKKHAGSFGLLGCLSFNGNKIITTGSGGMIVTNDEVLGQKAKHLTTQAKSKAEEYYHDEIGYNYRMPNILAAMGLAQMEQLPAFVERKKQIASSYTNILCKLGVVPQKMTDDVDSNHWLYTVKMPRQADIRKYLSANAIEVRPFWVPMNQLPAFKNDLYYHEHDFSNKIYEACLSLPCSTSLTDEQQKKVIHYIQQCLHA